MNKGLEMATGSIIGFLNSDDFYASDQSIAKIVSVFLRHNVDCVYGDLCYVDPLDTSCVFRYWKSEPFSIDRLKSGFIPPHPTFYTSKRLVKTTGSFDTHFKLAADFDFMLRCLSVESVRAYYLNFSLVNMRLGGATNKNLFNILVQKYRNFIVS